MFVPRERPPRTFESIEEICNYLLAHKEVGDLVRVRGPGGKAVFLMFDEETEERRRASSTSTVALPGGCPRCDRRGPTRNPGSLTPTAPTARRTLRVERDRGTLEGSC